METNKQRDIPEVSTAHPRVIVVGNLTIDDVVLPDGTKRMASVGGNSHRAGRASLATERRVGDAQG